MKKTFKYLFSLIAVGALLLVFACDQAGQQGKSKSKTLTNTKGKGFVRCGVSQGLPGFSNADESGNWSGVDVDVCDWVG